MTAKPRSNHSIHLVFFVPGIWFQALHPKGQGAKKTSANYSTNLSLKSLNVPARIVTFSRANAWVDATGDPAPMKRMYNMQFSNITVENNTGLYLRHVKGLVLQHVDFSTAAADARPPAVLVDVESNP